MPKTQGIWMRRRLPMRMLHIGLAVALMIGTAGNPAAAHGDEQKACLTAQEVNARGERAVARCKAELKVCQERDVPASLGTPCLNAYAWCGQLVNIQHDADLRRRCQG